MAVSSTTQITKITKSTPKEISATLISLHNNYIDREAVLRMTHSIVPPLFTHQKGVCHDLS